LRLVGADQARPGLLLPAIVVAVLLAGAALAVFLVVGRDGGTSRPTTADVAAAMRSAGCTFRTYAVPAPPNGAIVLPSRAAKIRWPTSPPSAGRHYSAGSVLGFYGQPLEPAPIVKNLENGVVVIWYGQQIAPAFLHRLEDFYQQSPEAMLASPYPALGRRAAIAAWTGDPDRYRKNGYWGQGNLAVCPKFDVRAFATFRDAFRGLGPNRMPLSALRHG
jgi:hypothetical protein